MSCNGSHVVFISFVDVSISDTSVYLPCYAVSVSFGVFCGINEKAFFHGFEISAALNDLLHEQADLAPRVFAPVAGCHVEIPRVVLRDVGGLPVGVQLEQVELAFRPDPAGQPHVGELSKKALTYSLLGVLVFLVLADHVGETQHSWQSVFGTLGAVVIYYFCIRAQGGPKKLHRLAIMIFLVVALAELGYGMLSGAGKYVPGFEPQYENHPGNPYIQDRKITDFIEEAEPFILLEDTRPVPDNFVSPGFSAGVLVTSVSALVFILLHRLNPGNIAGGYKRKRNGVPTPKDPSDDSYDRKDRETEETMPEKMQPEAIDCTEAGPEPAERKDR